MTTHTPATLTAPEPPPPPRHRVPADAKLPWVVATGNTGSIVIQELRDSNDLTPITLEDLLANPRVDVDMGVLYPGLNEPEWVPGAILAQTGYEKRLRLRAVRYFIFNPIGGQVMWVVPEPGLPEWAEIVDFPSDATMLQDVWLACDRPPTISEKVLRDAARSSHLFPIVDLTADPAS